MSASGCTNGEESQPPNHNSAAGSAGKPTTIGSGGSGGSSSENNAGANSRAGSSSNPNPQNGGWLSTKGNKIVHEDGSVFRGRGANIHDTRSCNACAWSPPNPAEVKRRVDALAGEWGANFMRLLLESYASADGREQYQGVLQDSQYLTDMKEVVAHIGTKKGVYVLLSLWDDPTFNELGWPTAQTIPVWEKLAETFAHDSHVLFGIVNEPQKNYDGKQDAQVWQAMNDTVEAIRAVEKRLGVKQHLIAVQGTRGWARNLEYYVDHPITAGGGTNIVYETHAYLKESEFEQIWQKPSETLPVIIGEFGPAGLGGADEMTMEETQLLMKAAEARDVPWLAWSFHMRCPPNLLVETAKGCGEGMPLQLTDWGKQVKTRLSAIWAAK
jgi:endoglucanase